MHNSPKKMQRRGSETKTLLSLLSLTWGTEADENCGKVTLCMSSLDEVESVPLVKVTLFGS